MTAALEIAFHNLQPSPSLEEDIRNRFDKLERLYNRITTARVAVEAPNRTNMTGNRFEVHIRMHVPGEELIVKREPESDARIAVRNAFDAAERRLLDYKKVAQGHVKHHEA
jgi:ribosome-associated translation inhibitor RaiA